MRRSEDVFKLSQKSMNRFMSLDFCSPLDLPNKNRVKITNLFLGLSRVFLVVVDLDPHSVLKYLH